MIKLDEINEFFEAAQEDYSNRDFVPALEKLEKLLALPLSTISFIDKEGEKVSGKYIRAISLQLTAEIFYKFGKYEESLKYYNPLINNFPKNQMFLSDGQYQQGYKSLLQRRDDLLHKIGKNEAIAISVMAELPTPKLKGIVASSSLLPQKRSLDNSDQESFSSEKTLKI